MPHTALRNVPKLKRLSLSFNRIAVVSGELFAATPLLKQVSLSYNVIRELNEESFQSLKSLRKLDLRGNQVNVRIPAITLKYDYIRGNDSSIPLIIEHSSYF